MGVAVHEKIISLHRQLIKNPFEGLVESVPAYSSLAVFHRKKFEDVKIIIETLLEKLSAGTEQTTNIIRLPVLYDGEDLDTVARQHQLSADEVIRIHTSRTYRVFMIGFLPGFPYLGEVDERIATPRKSAPRTAVAAGSVGIAGKQTGIYPQQSPGGWQLIGRTPLKIFDASKKTPCLLCAGDSVAFYAITLQEYNRLNEY